MVCYVCWKYIFSKSVAWFLNLWWCLSFKSLIFCSNHICESFPSKVPSLLHNSFNKFIQPSNHHHKKDMEQFYKPPNSIIPFFPHSTYGNYGSIYSCLSNVYWIVFLFHNDVLCQVCKKLSFQICVGLFLCYVLFICANTVPSQLL